jgi:HAE1 family hydrophobic/amphiphilic exporter-1
MATLVTLYITPVAYLLLARFGKPHAQEAQRLHDELENAKKSKANDSGERPLMAAE